jgi:tetratricopeptide (TPR) repeat protein
MPAAITVVPLKKFLHLALLCSVLLGGSLRAQTFEINGQSSEQKPKSETKQKKNKQKQTSDEQGNASGGMGWGQSIEVGRTARAATEALRKGNYGAAMNYAQRMTQAAPNDAHNWFLLAYAARLAGKYQASLDAGAHGLRLDPQSVEGLSGMAQTYVRMGRLDDAKRTLLQVIAANPRRAIDLALAGELFMKTGDLPQATNLLERSEAVQPSSHAEVMLAIVYMKQKQPEKAKGLLDKARARDPKNVDVFRAVAQFYREAHDYKSAIETLKQAPRKNADLMAELGYTYELAGMKNESASTYEKAAAMAPNVVTVQLAAAQAQMRAGNLDKTRTFLARAEQLDARHYRLHAIRGDLATLERRDTDAAREYQAALAAMTEAPAEGMLYPVQVRLSLIDAFKNLGDDAAVAQQVQLAQQQLATMQAEGTERVEYLRLRASIKGLGNDTAGAEADLKQALQIDPTNDNVMLQYGSLLWKIGRKSEARQMYSTLLAKDANNRFALEGLGYLSRDDGDNKAAEMYFNHLAAAYPNDYVPYLALGDLYTAIRDYDRADASYQKAWKLAPTNSMIVSSGSNAAIAAHNIDLAGEWVSRATGSMKNDPRVVRETERYLFHKGKYAESARLGAIAVQKLPHDRDAAVYLAYDLYNLGRYDDVLLLASRYETAMPKEPNFPLLAGHVHKQSQLLQQAIDDYTRVLQIDPHLPEALINRGYVRNDMQNSQAALGDFEQALKIMPNSGTAHLGLAFSDLQLHRARPALSEIEAAEKLIGESGATHMARATAYRQTRVFDKAEQEYRMALKMAPDDLKMHMALADTLYHAHHYSASIAELEDTLRLSPDDPLIYADLAAAHAQLHHQKETFQYIEAAERQANDQSGIFMATGEALLTLGDRNAAMERFTKALEAPDANRVDVRLEFAKLFVREGKFETAKQQVALAFAESRVGEASPVTTDNMVEAANVFLSAHDFDLALRYFEKARDMGAADDSVAVGMAETYLAQGNDLLAEKTLIALGDPADHQQDVAYQLAWGNVYHERHDTRRALSAFAHANQIAEDDPVAEHALVEVGGEEGDLIQPKFSFQSNAYTTPIFDDATLYQMDAKLFGAPVAPRYSQQTEAGTSFRYHLTDSLPLNAYFGERNTRGTISVPSELLIINRNTYDTLFSVGTSTMVRLGSAKLVLDPGIGFTVRRDSESPFDMNQNLFREFLYVNSSPLFNWITVRGQLVHEHGPFTERNLSSTDLGGRVEFEVGRPWGNTALITGYSVRDLVFSPLAREFHTTSAWGGLQHKFGSKLTVAGLGQYVRSFRVQDLNSAVAQALIPGARVEFKPTDHWAISGNFDLTRGEGFHLYDNVQSGFVISYLRPLRRSLRDGSGGITVEYPLKISVGLQQQSFTSYSGPGQASAFRPFISVTLF